MKITNKTWAIQDAVPAMPVNQRATAIMTTIKKIRVQLSMSHPIIFKGDQVRLTIAPVS